jgi:hypothetical protein
VTFDEFVAEVCERLRADMQSIRHPDGDIHPALFYSFDGESIRRFKIPRSWFETRETKDVMAYAIEQATTMVRPQMIAFETTAYMLSVPPEDIDRVNRERGNRPISEMPGRMEIVQVIAISHSDQCVASSEIARDGRNPPTFAPFEVRRPDRMEGALWEPLQRGMQG